MTPTLRRRRGKKTGVGWWAGRVLRCRPWLYSIAADRGSTRTLDWLVCAPYARQWRAAHLTQANAQQSAKTFNAWGTPKGIKASPCATLVSVIFFHLATAIDCTMEVRNPYNLPDLELSWLMASRQTTLSITLPSWRTANYKPCQQPAATLQHLTSVAS
jgi:hypothetical protein